MALSLYDQLSREGRTLSDEAHAFLKAHYDPASSFVYLKYGEQTFTSVRESMYYALSLMMREEQGAEREIEKICRAVLSLQIDAPKEIFHGVFRHDPREPVPPANQMDYRRLGPFGRYYADVTYEQVTDRLWQKLQKHPELQKHTDAIEALIHEALIETVPVVWDTYEPNIREFVLMCFAMLLQHGRERLSPALAADLEKSVRMAMDGAIARSQINMTPLNTNIQCMHIFLLDHFGQALGETAWRDYALSYAQGVLQRYRAYHACAEFNSPTYCGVDLSTLGFIRRYSDSEPLKALAQELEEGIWRDMAEFYNPAMRNFCGPYSRAYELDMGVHTCFCDMLYWALGEQRFPWHPFSIESVINPLMLLGDIRIPEDVKPAFLTPKQDAVLYHQFRELSERGDPENNSALCTATGWITPDLMVGALSGSENPSYQLHPFVAFWRQKEGLGTIKLLRCLPDGRMTHLHTVFFNGKADRNHVVLDVEAKVSRDVDIFFEIEGSGLEESQISDAAWQLPGLRVSLSCQGPKPVVHRISERTLRVIYPARIGDPASMRMRFDMDLQLTR